jgi:hypothetical protein
VSVHDEEAACGERAHHFLEILERIRDHTGDKVATELSIAAYSMAGAEYRRGLTEGKEDAPK